MHKGRYPVIYHGMAVASTRPLEAPLPRNGLVCHDSHCTVTNNTVVGYSGSGIFIEDGTETGV
jgi:parallel beta-helix repeat protein